MGHFTPNKTIKATKKARLLRVKEDRDGKQVSNSDKMATDIAFTNF